MVSLILQGETLSTSSNLGSGGGRHVLQWHQQVEITCMCYNVVLQYVTVRYNVVFLWWWEPCVTMCYAVVLQCVTIWCYNVLMWCYNVLQCGVTMCWWEACVTAMAPAG